MCSLTSYKEEITIDVCMQAVENLTWLYKEGKTYTYLTWFTWLLSLYSCELICKSLPTAWQCYAVTWSFTPWFLGLRRWLTFILLMLMFCCHLECWLLNQPAEVWHLFIQVHTYLLAILDLSLLGWSDFLGNGIQWHQWELLWTTYLWIYPVCFKLHHQLFHLGGGGEGEGTAESRPRCYEWKLCHNLTYHNGWKQCWWSFSCFAWFWNTFFSNSG